MILSQFKDGLVCTSVSLNKNDDSKYAPKGPYYVLLDGYDFVVESPPEVGKRYRLVLEEMPKN